MTTTQCKTCRQTLYRLPNGSLIASDESVMCTGSRLGDRVKGHESTR